MKSLALAPFLLLVYVRGTSSLFYQSTQTNYRCLSGLTQGQLVNLTVTMANYTRFYGHFLSNILIPRIPDTPTHAQVRQFIETQMQETGWTVELDRFESPTPLGVKTFTNIVATLNPQATRRVVFACHYDSKYMGDSVRFVGATDSAVPCAILMDTAWAMTSLLLETHSSILEEVTPQFIFFDGEEAFQRWSATDSLYGSTHLADKWLSMADPNDVTASNYLDNIEFFLLLDLIGGPVLKFTDYYRNTTRYFYSLYQTEYCLRTSGILPRRSQYDFMFNLWSRQTAPIEDDHIPFIQKGVPILHLISYPFPRVWHTLQDDLEHLDTNVIAQFTAIFRTFYFRLFSGAIAL